MAVRPQYHFRESSKGLQAWDVRRLIEKSSDLPVLSIPIQQIQELEEPYWGGGVTRLTVRDVADHAKLIEKCDLSFPVILCSEGRLMDGMHRVCKAYLLDHKNIEAVKFPYYIPPDYIGVQPDQLPY